MKTRQLAALTALLSAVLGLGACDAGSPGLRLELPSTLRLAQLDEEDAARLSATFEVPGLLAESPLVLSADRKEATGAFTVDVAEAGARPFTLRLKYTAEGGEEVLLARLAGEVEITPREENVLEPDAAGFDVCGAREEGAPCALLFDRNRNGAPNLDDLVAGLSPLPPPPFVDAAPSFLQFPSGIRLGDFARQVIVVENSSARPIEARAALVGAPGVTLSRYETTQSPENAALRSLELGTIAPFEQAFLAVSFAPVNAYLTVGDVYIEAYDAETRVSQATKVRVIANADGDLRPPPASGSYAPAPLVEDAELGGYPGIVEAYDPRLLFSGLTNNQVQSLAYTGATLSAVFPGEPGGPGRPEAIPADRAFLVEIPAGHKLSVSLGGLGSDVDLAVLLLDEGDAISDDPSRNLRAVRSGTSPEAVEVRASEAAPERALLVLGRVELEPPPAVAGALSASEPAPVELLVHVAQAPEFTAPPEPVRGPLEGGNRVVLTGRGFSPHAQVTFAGAVALDCSHEPGEEQGTSRLSCTAPEGSLLVGRNPATLVVENPSVDEGGDGQAASLVQGYVYEPPAPRLDELRPAVAPIAGSDGAISVRGAFFSRRNGLPEVRFGDEVASEVTFVDSSRLEVVAPPHAPGLVSVTVQNVLDPLPEDPPDLRRLSLPSNVRNFAYITPQGPAPTLSAVTPGTGSVDGGFSLALSGSGFVEGMLVNVGGIEATSVVVEDETLATAIAPALDAAGPTPVEVVNPDGQRAVLDDAVDYFVPPPRVDGVFPEQASTSGGTFVVVNGAGFRSGVRVFFLDGDSTPYPAANVNRVSGQALLVATPAVPAGGAYTLRVENLDGQGAEHAEAFSFLAPQGPPPVIEEVQPGAAELGSPPTVVVLRGGGFREPTVLMGSAHVTLSPLEEGESAAEVIRFIPVEPALPGPASIRVVNDDGQSDTAVFTWFAPVQPTPRLEQVVPAEAAFLETEPVTLSVRGTELPVVADPESPGALMLDPNARLRFGTLLVPHADIDFTSESAFSFLLPNLGDLVGGAPVTTIAITLTSPDGQVASIDFRYLRAVLPDPPEVQAVSPEAAPVGQTVTLFGERFGQPPLVRVGGVLVQTANGSDTSLSFEVPALPGVALPASVAVRVTDPESGLSGAAMLTVLPDAPPPVPPAVTLVLPEIAHARVPGEKLRVLGVGLAVAERVVVETAGGAEVLGDATVLSQSDTLLEVELPFALDDAVDTGARYQIRLVAAGLPDAVSPGFEAHRPRVYLFSREDDGGFVLGEHLHPSALVGAQLAGGGDVHPLSIVARTETLLRLTANDIESLVPGASYHLELIYQDPITSVPLPPLVVTGAEAPPLMERPLELSVHDPVPAGSDLGGVLLRAYLNGEEEEPLEPSSFGAPAGFEVLDETGALVASGDWSLVGCCDVDLAFGAGTTLAEGEYGVRLVTDRSPALAMTYWTRMQAIERRIVDVNPAVLIGGMSLEVRGAIFPDDVLVAERTTDNHVVLVPISSSSACGQPGDCPFTASDTSALTEGSWRLCAVSASEAAQSPTCPDGPLVEVVGDACDEVTNGNAGGYLSLPLDRFYADNTCGPPSFGRVVSLTFPSEVRVELRGTTTPARTLRLHVLRGACTGERLIEHCGGPGDSIILQGGVTYDLLVLAEGANEAVEAHLAITAEHPETGECLVVDGDADGFTECEGDCAEGDGAAYPGAAEVCDGVDNDCDFLVDNLGTSCPIAGQQGACAVGREVCQADTPVCEQVVFAGQEPEVCGDGVDNDCDGTPDEVGCVDVTGRIPFAPEPPPDGPQILANGNTLEGPFPIGFSFQHFGEEVTQFHASSYGFLTFNGDGYGSGPPSQLPSPDGLNGLVAAAWADLYVDQATSVVSYETRGEAPNRRLVVDFFSLPYCCGSGLVTSQIILFEGSNRVEIHTTEIAPSPYMVVTQGVENRCGTVAQVLPRRNAEVLGLTNDAVQFVPVVQPGGCGDCSCGQDESFETCPADCGGGGGGACGNGLCETGEPEGCPEDCGGGRCGNTICEPEETPEGCALDCGGNLCGNGLCELGEDGSCTTDCPLPCDLDWICEPAQGESTAVCDDCRCGDGVCEDSEDSFTCPGDCQSGDAGPSAGGGF